MEKNKVYQGDCLKLINQVDDESIDLIVCDGPFGVTGNSWDKIANIQGKFSKTKFNEDGKNPGDVWGDIKQLTYKSKELISRDFLNTIQKPMKLIERIVQASSKEGDVVLDPFAGVGTTFVVCKEIRRNFIGFEINPDFIAVCNKRIREANPRQEGALFEWGSLLGSEEIAVLK